MELIREIESHSKDGWILQGGVSISHSPDGIRVFAQAMIKEEGVLQITIDEDSLKMPLEIEFQDDLMRGAMPEIEHDNIEAVEKQNPSAQKDQATGGVALSSTMSNTF